MKAAVLEELNKPLAIKELEVPVLGVGQVLVDIHYSSICGAQIGEISGAKGEDKYLPHLLGHEGGGIVKEIGPGVKHVKKGDHVVMHWRKGRGIEADCPKYRDVENHSVIGGGWVTTFAEQAIISENRLTPIDKDIPLDIAALMGCAVTTGLGIINNEAQLKIGQSIAVIGCGGVGLNVIQGAKIAGANRIIGIDVDRDKLGQAINYGAMYVTESAYMLDYSPTDIVVDCTGIPEMIDKGLCLVKPGGKMILVGQTRHGEDLTLKSFKQHYCGKTILDSQGGLTEPYADIPRYLKLYQQGKLQLDKLITHRFKLDHINEALDVVRSGKAGRVMLEMR